MPKEKRFLGPKPKKEKLFIKSGKGASSEPATISEAMANMSQGDERSGRLGGKHKNLRLPDYVPEPENLDRTGANRKKAVQDLLAKVIQPISLGIKATPDMDKRSLVNKLKKQTLVELERFLPTTVNRLTTEQLEQVASGETDIEEEDKAEIQSLYMDISP